MIVRLDYMSWEMGAERAQQLLWRVSWNPSGRIGKEVGGLWPGSLELGELRWNSSQTRRLDVVSRTLVLVGWAEEGF